MGKGPYKPNEEIELEQNTQEIKRAMDLTHSIQQMHMGVMVAPTTGLQHINGERIHGEVFHDSLSEAFSDSSIEETAHILKAITTVDTGTWLPCMRTANGRAEIKQEQDKSPEIQSAIRALKLNEKGTIQASWEKTPLKQRNPIKTFLL